MCDQWIGKGTVSFGSFIDGKFKIWRKFKVSDIYKENYEMRERIKDMRKCFSEIDSIIYCIGGPLNDNCLQFTKKQMGVFREIADICRAGRDE